jgi:hypothetical protein
MATTSHFFQFEADFVDSLRCIPMQVRLKLDTCGVKLKLHHWSQFSADERQRLAQMPCASEAATTTYRDYLQGLVGARPRQSGEKPAHRPGSHPGKIPRPFPQKSIAQVVALGHHLTPEQWQTLSPLQRFALIKLSRPGHENRNFYPALVEFGLAA